MAVLHTLDEYNAFIRENDATMIYFSQEDCSVCKVLKPDMEDMLAKHFPKMQFAFVDCLKDMDLPAQLNVLVVPTIIVNFDGREYFRKYRNMSIPEFRSEIKRIYDMMFED
jgi:thiol-disulfide isomerase/thioredoxin